MPTSYEIIGADGAGYGPVALNELRNWVKQGRVVGSTQVRRGGEEHWSTASSFPELGVVDRVGSPALESVSDTAETEELEKRIKSGGSWFYWIAALTLTNSIIVLAGSDWSFVLGLSITQMIDGAVVTFAGKDSSLIFKLIAFLVDLIAVGLFVFLGVQAGRKQTWAFVVGVTLYGLDTLLTLLSLSIVSIGIHGWALFCLAVGLKAAQQWRKTNHAQPVTSDPVPA